LSLIVHGRGSGMSQSEPLGKVSVGVGQLNVQLSDENFGGYSRENSVHNGLKLTSPRYFHIFMKGIQNVQNFWQKCGVVEVADFIRLNTIVPDSRFS